MKFASMWFSIGVIFGPPAALGSELALGQLNHRSFSLIEGAPGGIRAFTQTTDGTLWVASSMAGLWRFDGQRFVSYPQPSDPTLPSANVTALMASPDGGLWIGFRVGGLGFLKQGKFTRYAVHDGVPDGLIRQFVWDAQGTLWVAANRGISHLVGNHWEPVAPETVPQAIAVLPDEAGTLWVQTNDSVLARFAGEERFSKVLDLDFPDQHFYPSITSGPHGQIWTVVENTLVEIESDPKQRTFRVRTLPTPDVGPPLLIDDRQQLWLGRQLLHRTDLSKMNTEGGHNADPLEIEQFGHSDAFSRSYVTAFFEDREKNIWVGMTNGLDRFSPPTVVKHSLPWCSGAQVPVPGENGTLWVACPIYGRSSGTVTEIRDGMIVGHQDTGQFTAAYGNGKDVWFAGPQAIGHLQEGRIVTTPVPARAVGSAVQSILADRTGALWISVIGKGLYKIVDGEWVDYGGLSDLPRKPAYVESLDPEGTIWLGYLAGDLIRIEGTVARHFGKRDGVDIGFISAIYPYGGYVWVAGEKGLLRYDGRTFIPVLTVRGESIRSASGIVASSSGDLWLNTVIGIMRIDSQELNRPPTRGALRFRVAKFDQFDGVPGVPPQTRPSPTAYATSEGRIWFDLSDGLVSIDTTHAPQSPPPPPVTIWSVTSGTTRLPYFGALLHLPVHTTQLAIDYTAGTLTTPEHVRFRYMLQGVDADWQEVGNQHEAHYTNLAPGDYTFRVAASNQDGMWGRPASVPFTIAPAFYQTHWFHFVCATAFVGLLYLMYALRMRQLARQMKSRLEARLSERERIARELHDTLLQAVQALIWRFETVARRVITGELAPEHLQQTLDRAEQTLQEGRERVKELRGRSADGLTLCQAIALEGEQLAQGQPARFQTSVEGSRRNLHPIVHEEVLFIAREALRNAFRHAEARIIEAEVSYGAKALHVRVRDDGRGITAGVLENGQPGHFGLLGMQERARKMRARVDIWSKPAAGTEIDLQVPADVAYQRPVTLLDRARWVWGKPFSGSDSLGQ